MRSKQGCNLTEVVVKEHDTVETLREKVRLATILGTMQSTLTDFKYLRKEWRENCEEERLLGVSLTGTLDNKLTANYSKNLAGLLTELKEYSVTVNKEWAKKLGINQSAAITCVKPSGTVSQLTNTSSGIHARYSPYYIRTVRIDKSDPLAKLMIDSGFLNEDDVTKPDRVSVFSFPVKSPTMSVLRDHMTAIAQLKYWHIFKTHWCEHNPSVTIHVKEHEWLEVGAWVYENFNDICGVTFLPHTDHIYKQAPYQEITKDQYESMVKIMPKNVDWESLVSYENTDQTVSSALTACVGDVCEIVDIV